MFNSSITINEYQTASGTSYGHANAAGAESVGAAYYAETPQFGTDPAVVEDFSSAGGVPILFDVAGNRLPAPEVRDKPEIVAPDGTNTTFFGSDFDSDGFPNFFGTSAAAPHAAAVAALLLEANPSLLPHEVYAALEQTALDMDDPSTPGFFDTGFDFATGHGLIQADTALFAVAPQCPGDLNGDGSVDTDDLGIFAGVFGTANCSENCLADRNADDDVDGMDLDEFIRHFVVGCN